jgi:hypothetical protein
MYLMILSKKVISTVLFLSIFISPLFAWAQVVNNENITPSPVVESSLSTEGDAVVTPSVPETVVPDNQQSLSPAIQEATPGQVTLPGDNLIVTSNPQPTPDPTDSLSQSATTSTPVISTEEGTTTPILPSKVPIPSVSSATSTNASTTPSIDIELPVTLAPTPMHDVTSSENEESILATLSMTDLAPSKEYIV